MGTSGRGMIDSRSTATPRHRLPQSTPAAAVQGAGVRTLADAVTQSETEVTITVRDTGILGETNTS